MNTKLNPSVLCLLIAVITPLPSLNAQDRSPSPTLTVLYTFLGDADGALPFAGVVLDPAGNIYGATVAGGVPNNVGTAFKIDSRQHLTVLHSFGSGSDGYDPRGGVIRDSSGILYGATNKGGTRSSGTVYSLNPRATVCVTALCPWNENNLHSFFGPPDGEGAMSALLRDSQGNLYGTTSGGGDSNCGTIFKVDPHGNETILHSFSGFDGCYPAYGALIQDALGNLYGTTVSDGINYSGVVFELEGNGQESVLYRFTSKADGGGPYNGVIADGDGTSTARRW